MKDNTHQAPGTMNAASPGEAFEALVEVMRRLRAPEGCPWDREQNFETLKPYLIEEAFEVLEAMGEASHCEELGDLLLQIVFQARLAEEAGDFDIKGVVEGIRDKMIRRHPHVFGDENARNAEDVRENWERRKRDERRAHSTKASVLDGVPRALPALLQATRMTEKASRVGFDWKTGEEVWEKLREELHELREACAALQKKTLEGRAIDKTSSEDPEEEGAANALHHAIEHEFGDVLFTLVNLGRFLKLNPEEALRKANRRFESRFRHMEKCLHEEGLKPEEVSLDALNHYWEAAKSREKEGG